jgi:hypothetical protein
MNDEMANQSSVTGPEAPLDDSPTEVEVIELELDDDPSYRGPESWREVADTLGDPIEPG